MTTKIITAASAKKSARIFDLGNLLVTALPILIPFWFGASMFVYAFLRHHPNPMVGEYTQWAAYRFYGMIGAIIPVATFFPVDIRYYLVTWAVIALVMVPWSLWSLKRIGQDSWHDTEYEASTETA
jgi:hypothetical protein